MKYLVGVLPLLAVSFVSCDKAKEAVGAARDKFDGVQDVGLPRAPGGEVSADLVAQMDTAAEGVRFRRDLPFPSSLQVRVTQRVTFQRTRMITTSALGSETTVANGTFELVGMIDRRGSQLAVTIEKLGPVIDPKEAVEKAKAKAEGVPTAPAVDPPNVVGARVEFQQTASGWRPSERRGSSDFNAKILEQDLQPNLPRILVENGVMPRTQWFSSARRWLGGDKLVLEGDSLALLFPESSGGKVTLTYEVMEPVEGHPCGRFVVSGDISLKEATGIDGSSTSGEITIQSGKVWCSLLHPLVLREELQTVKTVTQGQGGGPKQKIQGAVEELKVRQWNP